MDVRRGALAEYGDSGREDHRYEDTRGDDIVPANIGLRDQKPCIDSCFHQFVDEWNVRTSGRFGDVCYQLSQLQSNTELWKLYCCDMTKCGVWTGGGKGQSPSVDLIINECQNAGNYLIYDPGPPSSNVFSCSSAASDAKETGSATISSSGAFYRVVVTTTSSSSSSSSATETSSGLNSTASHISAAPETSTGLTEGSKAAIGICSALAIIAIVFLVSFLICRRRSHRRSFLDRAPSATRLGGSSSEPPGGSRTSLISPPPSAKGPPLTPPARLSDRRFLPSLLKQGGTPNSSLASGMDNGTLLSSTLDVSMEKKSALRHEGWANVDSVAKSPVSPSTPVAVHFAPYFLRDSGSSYSSGPGGASTTTIGSNKAGSVHSRSATITGTNTPPLLLPLSPSRPPRPHDAPLEIPNLVTPAGPPPNRALPAPPPYHPISPTFPVSPVSPPSSPTMPFTRQQIPTGGGSHAFSTPPLSNTDAKGNLDPSPIDNTLPASTKDLRDLTESYARETSESWGSWGGGGGGGPGVSITGGKKKGHKGNISSRENSSGEKKGERGSTLSLQKLDLEKLGGKY